MSEIIGPPPTFKVPPTSGKGPDHAQQTDQKHKKGTSDQQDNASSKDQSGTQSKHHTAEPAVTVSASMMGLKVGDEVKGQVEKVTPDDQLIFITKHATFLVEPSADMKSGQALELEITSTSTPITANIVKREAQVLAPPIPVEMTLIQVSKEATESAHRPNVTQTMQLPHYPALNTMPKTVETGQDSLILSQQSHRKAAIPKASQATIVRPEKAVPQPNESFQPNLSMKRQAPLSLLDVQDKALLTSAQLTAVPVQRPNIAKTLMGNLNSLENTKPLTVFQAKVIEGTIKPEHISFQHIVDKQPRPADAFQVALFSANFKSFPDNVTPLSATIMMTAAPPAQQAPLETHQQPAAQLKLPTATLSLPQEQIASLSAMVTALSSKDTTPSFQVVLMPVAIETKTSQQTISPTAQLYQQFKNEQQQSATQGQGQGQGQGQAQIKQEQTNIQTQAQGQGKGQGLNQGQVHGQDKVQGQGQVPQQAPSSISTSQALTQIPNQAPSQVPSQGTPPSGTSVSSSISQQGPARGPHRSSDNQTIPAIKQQQGTPKGSNKADASSTHNEKQGNDPNNIIPTSTTTSVPFHANASGITAGAGDKSMATQQATTTEGGQGNAKTAVNQTNISASTQPQAPKGSNKSSSIASQAPLAKPATDGQHSPVLSEAQITSPNAKAPLPELNQIVESKDDALKLAESMRPDIQATPTTKDIPVVALKDALQAWPVMAASAQALASALSPALQGQMANRLPNMGQALQNSTLFFMAAVGLNDPKTWLGKKVVSELEQKNQGNLLKALQKEFSRLFQLSGLGERTGAGSQVEWRPHLIPLFQNDQAQAMVVLTRPDDHHTDEQGGDQKGDKGSEQKNRFVVATRFKSFGMIELDGLLRPERLDLHLRSTPILPKSIQELLTKTVESALTKNELIGTVKFGDLKDSNLNIAEILDKAESSIEGHRSLTVG